jgi:hypothetical protein
VDKFEEFLKAVLAGSIDLARNTLGDVAEAAATDTGRFLRYSQERLREWTTELATGQMTKRQFADLVDDLPNLGELIALSELGIARAALQRFRDGLVKLVIDTAFKVFLA